jgi:hypothetical protein
MLSKLQTPLLVLYIYLIYISHPNQVFFYINFYVIGNFVSSFSKINYTAKHTPSNGNKVFFVACALLVKSKKLLA